MNGTDNLDDRFDRLQRRAMWVGAAGLTLWLLLVVLGLSKGGWLHIALGAYLIGYLYVLGIALGCLIMLMIQHVTGGNWGRAIRRVLEAGTRRRCRSWPCSSCRYLWESSRYTPGATRTWWPAMNCSGTNGRT